MEPLWEPYVPSISSVLFLFFCFLFQSFLSIPLSHCHPFLSLTPIMNCIQYVVLGLRGLHFHIDGFFGELENWMLLSWFFSFSFSSQRWRGQTLGRITPQRPNRSLLSKASQMHLSELNTYELCTGVGDDSSVTGADGGEGRGGRERDIEWYTGADAPTHSRTRAKRGSDAHNRAHARASIKSKCHWRQDHSKIH